MAISVVDQLKSGQRAFRVDLPDVIELRAADRVENSRMQGALSLKVTGSGAGVMSTLEFRRFGVISRGVSLRGCTGKLAVDGEFGGGVLARGFLGRWKLKMQVRAKVLYRAIQGKYIQQISTDVWVSPQESFEGYLEADLMELEVGGGDDLNELIVEGGRLRLVRLSKVLGLVDELDISLIGSTFRSVSSALAVPAISSCPQDRRVDKKFLRLLPMGFGNSEQDPNATGSSWGTQLANAVAIWKGCCLDFIPEPLRVIPVPTMMTSTDIPKIMQEGGRFADNTIGAGSGIEILIVKGDLPNGGGHTIGMGTGLAMVVITDKAEVGNPHLLAHELGHVLGGVEPGLPVSGKQWPGRTNTIMQESNSVGAKNPAARPVDYCQDIWNPNFVPSGKGCALPHP